MFILYSKINELSLKYCKIDTIRLALSKYCSGSSMGNEQKAKRSGRRRAMAHMVDDDDSERNRNKSRNIL